MSDDIEFVNWICFRFIEMETVNALKAVVVKEYSSFHLPVDIT